jgi:hypothetical protein
MSGQLVSVSRGESARMPETNLPIAAIVESWSGFPQRPFAY